MSFFKLWLTVKPFIIGPEDDPYLKRWYVVPRNRFFNVYVHKFCRSDDDRALHDHPWWWCSVLLNGSYIEHTEVNGHKIRTPRKRFSVAIRDAHFAHRVELYASGQRGNLHSPLVPAWTLFITGPKVRDWGFHCPKGWVPWEKFTKGKNGNEIGEGCGEYA